MKISGKFSRALGVLCCGLMIAFVSLGCERNTGGNVIKPKTYVPVTKSAVEAVKGQSLSMYPDDEEEGK